jgi:YVTN family beta-propeller protein
MNRNPLWAAGVALLGLNLLAAAETPQAALLVLAKTDHTLSIVDPRTQKVTGHVPSGPDPHEVIASEDGRFAYISNYGGGTYNTITPVDLSKPEALPPIDLGALRGPHGLTYVAGKLWFTAEGAKVIGSYDPNSSKIDWILGTGQNRTHMVYMSPDLSRFVTTNISSATITIGEKLAPRSAPAGGGMPPRLPGGDWNETVIPVGKGAEGFDLSPDGKEIWVANAQDGTISIVDMTEKKPLQTLEANVKGANRLKFTPDGKLVFVSSLSSPDLAIFDAAGRKETKRVKIGSGAAGLLMQPDGSRAYVACTPDSYVAVIDLKSLEVSGHIEAGKQPDGLAWVVRK